MPLIFVLASREVKIVGRTLISIEGISILVMSAVLIVIVSKLAGGFHGRHLSAQVFSLPKGTPGHKLILAAVFGVASFAGFEAAASLGEESLNPRRRVPISIAIAVVGSITLFVLVTTVIAMGFGVTPAAGAKLAASAGPLFELSHEYLSSTFEYVLQLGATVSAFSAALATLAGSARMIYALSRDGRPSLPFARLGKWGEPQVALVFVSVISLLLIVVLSATGTSGLNTAFYFGTIGTLAIIVAYGMVAVAAAKHMVAKQGGRARLGVIVPLAAFAIIVYLMYNELVPAPASPYNVFPYIVGGWLVIGLLLVLATPGLANRIDTGLERALETEPSVGDETGYMGGHVAGATPIIQTGALR